MFTEEKGFLNMQLLLLENRNSIITTNHYLLGMYERKKRSYKQIQRYTQETFLVACDITCKIYF